MAPKKQPQPKEKSVDTATNIATTDAVLASPSTSSAASSIKTTTTTAANTSAKPSNTAVKAPPPTSLPRKLVLISLITGLAVLSYVSLAAACFTHRDPLSVYLEQHFLLDHATRQAFEKNAERVEKRDPLEARKAFLESNLQKLPAPLSSHYFETKGDFLFNDAILYNNRGALCRHLVEPYFAFLFPIDEDYREDYGWIFEMWDEYLLPRFYGKSGVSSFLRILFEKLRVVDLWGTRTMLGEKDFGGAASTISAQHQESKKSNNNNDNNKMRMCNFARFNSDPKNKRQSSKNTLTKNSGVNNNNNNNDFGIDNSSSALAFDNTIAQLFDLINFNELREIFPLHGGFVKKGVTVLSFDEFVASSLYSTTTTGLKMLHYLRYLYSLPLIDIGVQNSSPSSSSSSFMNFKADSTFLGEFLNGIINIPSNAEEDNFSNEQIRFAVPENRINDGVDDCCDGSDETISFPSSSEPFSSANTKRQQKKEFCAQRLSEALYIVKDKLTRLARGYQTCVQRARNNHAKLLEFKSSIESRLAHVQPQWSALVGRYNELVPQYQQLHQVLSVPSTAAKAPQQQKQLYREIIAELQQVQQQLQQLQQFKTQSDSMVGAIATGGFGDSGQFVSNFQHPSDRLVEIAAKNKKRQSYYLAKEEEYAKNPENFLLDQELETLMAPKAPQNVYSCVSKRMSNKEIAGGSADPTGGSDQEIKICPFRYAEGADVNDLRKYAKKMINYKKKVEESDKQWWELQQKQQEEADKLMKKEKESKKGDEAEDDDDDDSIPRPGENSKFSSPTYSEEQRAKHNQNLPKPPHLPKTRTLGMFFGSVSFWPTFVMSGRKSFYDVVPQMPTRFATAKLAKSQNEYSRLVDQAFTKFQKKQEVKNQKQKKRLQQQQAQQPPGTFDPTKLFENPVDNVLAMRSQGSDVAQLLHDLVNRSATSHIEKLSKSRQEYIEKRKIEILKIRQEHEKEQQQLKLEKEQQKQQQQQQEKPVSDESSSSISETNNIVGENIINETEKVDHEDLGDDEVLKNLPQTEEDIAQEWDDKHADAEGNIMVDSHVEHRWHEENMTNFLKTASHIATDVSFFKNGEACWEGPAERTMAVFFVCGEKDRILDIREDGKCVYEAVVETPSACCQYREHNNDDAGSKDQKPKETTTQEQEATFPGNVNSDKKQNVVKDVSSGEELPKSIFKTRYFQKDNTLIRRYSAVERLLEMWLS